MPTVQPGSNNERSLLPCTKRKLSYETPFVECGLIQHVGGVVEQADELRKAGIGIR
jgi:hypothetical protein